MNPIKKTLVYLLFSILLYNSCAMPVNTFRPKKSFEADVRPEAPDYSSPESWAALPTKKDLADSLPSRELTDRQATAHVDVFFIYPTIYAGTRRGENQWNAPINDPEFNEEVDYSTILNQASIFNGVGRVYSPRYRQAHIWAYASKDRASAKKAFDFAYEDVKAAFLYYLKHHNEGRPFILAGHSQGTQHAEHLLHDLFDGQPLKNQLIAAYLVGMPVPRDTFKTIPPCATPEQIGCYCSWNTYSENHYPKNYHKKLYRATATNPLNWTLENTYAGYQENLGGVAYKFKMKEHLSDAQAVDGMVWIGKPNLFIANFMMKKNWHIGDYNLFYLNVRRNAQLRAATFLNKK